MGAKAVVAAVIVLAVIGAAGYVILGDYMTQDDTVQITVDFESGTGVQSTIGTKEYDKDADVTVKAEMKEGYSFRGWYDNAGVLLSTDNPYTFKAVTNLKLIAKGIADSAPKYDVTVEQTVGVNTETGTKQYYAGDKISLKVTISDHYSFRGWWIGSERISDLTEFVYEVVGSVTLTAKAVEDPYSIISAIGDEGIDSITGIGKHYNGEEAVLRATVKDGYSLVGWTVDGVTKCTESTYMFSVTSDVTVNITTTAIPKHSVVLYGSEGAETVEGAGSFFEGTSVTVRAVLKAGHIFDGWYSGAEKVSSDVVYTFNLEAPVELTAKAHKDPDALIVSIDKGTGIQAVLGQGEYSAGNYVTVSAAPSEGYVFNGWYVDGTMVSDCPVYGFEACDKKLTAKAITGKDTDRTPGFSYVPGEGIIEGEKVSGYYGEPFDLTATLEPGYSFLGWYDMNGTKDDFSDDILVSMGNPVKIVFTGVKLRAAAVPDTVIEVYSDSGITAVSGTGSFGPYDGTTLTAELEDGISFDGWYDIKNNKLGSDLSLRVDTVGSAVYLAKTDAVPASGTESLSIIGNPYDIKDCSTIVTDSRGDLCAVIKGKTQETIEGIPAGTYDVTYCGTDDEGHYRMITDSVSTDGASVKHYEWVSEGKEYVLDWDVDLSDYQTYKTRTDRVPNTNNKNEMASYAVHDVLLDQVVERLLYLSQGMTQQQRADFVLDFMQQSVEYELDNEHLGITDDNKEYWKYPYETLFDRAGDCEDGSLLYCYLMKELNYRTALMLVPGHMMASVHLDGEVAGQCVTDAGVSYYFVETTNNGSNVGENPGNYEGKDIKLVVPIPLNHA